MKEEPVLFWCLSKITAVTRSWHARIQKQLTLLHVNSNQCLDMPSEEDKMVPTLRDCSGSRSQQWLLRNMTLSI